MIGCLINQLNGLNDLGKNLFFPQDWDSDSNYIFLQMKLQAWLVAHTVFNMIVSTIITNTEMLMSGGVPFYSTPSLADPSESCSSKLNSFLLMPVCFSDSWALRNNDVKLMHLRCWKLSPGINSSKNDFIS